MAARNDEQPLEVEEVGGKAPEHYLHYSLWLREASLVPCGGWWTQHKGLATASSIFGGCYLPCWIKTRQKSADLGYLEINVLMILGQSDSKGACRSTESAQTACSPKPALVSFFQHARNNGRRDPIVDNVSAWKVFFLAA